MKSVAILGVSGALGQTFLRLLEHESGLHRIVGIDRRPPAYQPGGLEFHPADYRQAPLETLLRGVDALLLIAMESDFQMDMALSRPQRLEPFRRLLQQAQASGVEQLVVVCPIAALGSHEDNPVPIQEWRPLRPLPSNPLAQAWADVEDVLEQASQVLPGLRLIRLRTAPVVGGPQEDPHSRWLNCARAFAPLDYDPLLQLTHVEDLAQACLLTLKRGVRTVYQVAGPHPERFSELYGAAAVPVVHLPFSDWVGALHPRWAVLPRDLPQQIQALGPHPILVSTVAINHELGWSPLYSTREAFLQAREQLRGKRNRHAA